MTEQIQGPELNLLEYTKCQTWWVCTVKSCTCAYMPLLLSHGSVGNNLPFDLKGVAENNLIFLQNTKVNA